MTPKERFLADQARTKAWNSLIENPLFDLACDTVLAELASRQAAQSLPVYESQAATHRMQGVVIGLEALKKLGRKAEGPKIVTTPELDYESFDVQEGMKPKSEKM